MGLFSFGKSSASSKSLNWTKIETQAGLEKAIAATSEQPGLFFKHSTRCSISSMALNRFEKEWDEENDCELFFIDLIAHRNVSNQLSELTGIQHQSPQAILIKDGQAIYDASHNGIDANAIKSKL